MAKITARAGKTESSKEPMEWPDRYREMDGTLDQERLSRMALSANPSLDDPMPGQDCPVVHNVVCTCQLSGCTMPLNLQVLAHLLPSATYDKRTFAAVTVRTDQPFCTALLFSSGKLVVTGSKSLYECIWASYSIVGMLNNACAFPTFHVKSCNVQNMVAHGVLPVPPGGSLDIQRFYSCHSTESTYQKRMFPGLIYRSRSLKVVVLLFGKFAFARWKPQHIAPLNVSSTSGSAKIVLTGAKHEADITKGWEHINRIASDFLMSSGQ